MTGAASRSLRNRSTRPVGRLACEPLVSAHARGFARAAHERRGVHACALPAAARRDAVRRRPGRSRVRAFNQAVVAEIERLARNGPQRRGDRRRAGRRTSGGRARTAVCWRACPSATVRSIPSSRKRRCRSDSATTLEPPGACRAACRRRRARRRSSSTRCRSACCAGRCRNARCRARRSMRGAAGDARGREHRRVERRRAHVRSAALLLRRRFLLSDARPDRDVLRSAAPDRRRLAATRAGAGRTICAGCFTATVRATTTRAARAPSRTSDDRRC